MSGSLDPRSHETETLTIFKLSRLICNLCCRIVSDLFARSNVHCLKISSHNIILS